MVRRPGILSYKCAPGIHVRLTREHNTNQKKTKAPLSRTRKARRIPSSALDSTGIEGRSSILASG